MKYVFLSVAIISGLIHLYGSFLDNRRIRSLSKGFIVISLAFYYLTATQQPRIWTFLALLFSWLADLLLIPAGTKWFVIGGIFFMISHGFFIISYAEFVSFALVPWAVIVLAAGIYLAVSLKVFSGLSDSLKKSLFYPMLLYLLINGTMNCFALFQLISQHFSRGAVLTFIGAVLFFISDSNLFYVRFKKDREVRNHFWVMLTYITAEFLIVIGLMILSH